MSDEMTLFPVKATCGICAQFAEYMPGCGNGRCLAFRDFHPTAKSKACTTHFEPRDGLTVAR